MQRRQVLFGILGLALAAPAARAAAPTTIKIFGQNYSVVKQSRAQTYKNGVQIHLDNGMSGVNNFAGIYFAEGKDPTGDRLWFAARISNDNGNDAKGDQLYYLEGSDAMGMFLPAVSNAKSFFGGNVDKDHGRRPVNVIELNRDDTGKKKDRNVLAETFWDDDSLRMYDLDTMDGYGGTPGSNDADQSHPSDALFQRVKPSQSVSAGDAGDKDGDPNLPRGDYVSSAHLPTPDGHTVISAGGPGDNGETAVSIWDTRKDDAFPVLTDITTQTKSAAKPFPQDDGQGNNLACVQIARYGSKGEYWFLLDNPSPGGSNDTERTAIVLVRTMLTLPADPSKAKPGDIKVTVMDTQDMMATAADILFPKGTAGITGITVGRELTAGGPRVLYTTDYDGNFYTLTPTP